MKTQRSFIKNIWLTECKLNWRKKYGVIFALAALFLCALEAFYVLPKDLVKGNSIALSSWITQVYIVFGLTYGLLLYEREQSEIKELLNSYSLSKWKKTVKYLLLFIEAAGIDLGCIFLLEISFCMQHMSVAIQHEALQYIAVYWISPFVIMGITGMVLADKIEGRGKYVIGVVVMILSGPMPQNLIAALTDTQTGLFKWVSFTNLGPMNTYKPMHLLFGYSIPMEKIAMLLFMLIGVTMIYFGTGSVQMSKKWIAGVAGGIFICVACILNFNYIVGHYSYDVAMRMQEEYQKKDRFDTNNNYSVTLLMMLDAQGICASSGSACASSSAEPSHVLTAIGLSDELAHASLRLTLGRNTTKKELDLVVSILKETIDQLRSISDSYLNRISR